jgi:hypothetical protein
MSCRRDSCRNSECQNCADSCEALPILSEIPLCDDNCLFSLSSKALMEMLQDDFISSSQED